MPWADDLPDSAPDPKREPFYLLVALKIGDPRTRDWLLNNGIQFHEMFRQYYGAMPEGASATAMIQYLLWYERDGPVDNTFTRGT